MTDKNRDATVPPEPKIKTVPKRDWKADFVKLEAFLVSIGHGHAAIKRILAK